MFENLTDKIESAFTFFNKITRLDEKQADEGLRKIRQALLESDVALSVTKKFIEDVRPKIIGQEVLKSVTPGQMIIKIVNDELIKVLGSEKSDLNLIFEFSKVVLVTGMPIAPWSGLSIVELYLLSDFVTLKIRLNCIP